jgi:hypothetical protein
MVAPRFSLAMLWLTHCGCLWEFLEDLKTEVFSSAERPLDDISSQSQLHSA